MEIRMQRRKFLILAIGLALPALMIIFGCATPAQQHINKGNEYYNQGQYDEAITEYSEAIELEPTNSEYYYNRGNAYLKKGQLQIAVADYDKAIMLDPEFVMAYNNRGQAYAGQMQFDTAIADFSKALE